MAWEKPSRQPTQYEASSETSGTEVRNSLSKVGFAQTTSTSTIVIEDGGIPRLRTFGIRAATIGQNLDGNASSVWSSDPIPTTGPCSSSGNDGSCPNDWICFLDSGRVDPAAFDCLAAYTSSESPPAKTPCCQTCA